MTNPHKRFEVEIAPIGVWFTPLDEFGQPFEHGAKYFNNQELENDINWLTKELQIYFNF